MKIAITSQNFRTITGHAGKARRFLVFSPDADRQATEVDRLDLPKDMSLHEYHGDQHPVLAFDVLITASCGQGFARRLANHGIEVLTTSETDPVHAATRYLAGESLPPAEPHDHDHDHSHEHRVTLTPRS